MNQDADRWLRAHIPAPPAPDPAAADAALTRLLAAHPARAGALRYTAVNSALGNVYVAYTAAGIALLSFTAASAGAFQEQVQERYGAAAERDDARQELYARQLAAWLEGRGARPRLDLSRLSPWEQQVLGKVVRISRGQVRPYSWVAREIGRPTASRAVGQVVAHNPVPLFVPCHRVVPAGGGLGNYAYGGTPVKEQLLRREGVDTDRLQTLAEQGLRFEGSRTTRIFCIPGCRHVQARHLIYFPTAAAAHREGYRPCKVCRPV